MDNKHAFFVNPRLASCNQHADIRATSVNWCAVITGADAKLKMPKL